MSINRVNISGNVGRDPEIRQTQGGTQVLTFSMAVSDRKRNPQSGQWEDVTNWIPCVVFGNRADSLSKFLSKGMKCAVEGKLRQSSYKDKSGQNRSKIEVIVDEVEFLSQSKGHAQRQSGGSGQTNSDNYQQPPIAEVYDEDIPF